MKDTEERFPALPFPRSPAPLLDLPHGVMVREDVFGLEDLAVVVTGALGLGHTGPGLIQVEPHGAEAALEADLGAFLIRVREGAAGEVAGGPTLQVHLASWAAQRWGERAGQGQPQWKH